MHGRGAGATLVTGQPHVLVLATADWDSPLWTNKQYLALELAREFQVTYVESLGLRKARLSPTDIRRVVRRAQRAVRPTQVRGHRRRPSNLEVASPVVVPFHGSTFARRVNPGILRRSLRAWEASPERLLWTFNPVTYGLHEIAHRTIYHAVDLLHASPRHYAEAIVAGERTLAAAGASAIASSAVVAQHLEEVGFQDVALWENVADVSLFAGEVGVRPRRPSVVLFAGNLSPFKVDFELLRSIASMPECELHIAGPAAIDGSVAPDIGRLRAAGAIFHGALAPRELAILAAEAAVGVIPYLQNDYTAGVFPMKLYEYLAAGAVVVSTPLPSLASHASPDVVVASSASEFVRAVRDNLRVPDEGSLARRQRAAAGASWELRGRQVRDAVRESFSGPLCALRSSALSTSGSDWKQRRKRLAVDGVPRGPRELVKSLVVLGGLRELGWQRSSRERRSVTLDGEPMPWLSYPALAWLSGRTSRINTVLEYGAGASTLWFLANGARVVSIEHDERWLQELETMLPTDGRRLIPAPADEIGYVEAIANAGLDTVDLALVDGLHRAACARAVLPYLRDDSLLCLDDSQRRDYAPIIDDLHAAGFRSIGFRGMAPIVGEIKETRFFSRSLGDWLDPV